MDDSAEDPSPIEQEIEALSSIYIDELSFQRAEDGQIKEVSLLLHPATGNDTTKQFVCMNLVFHITSQYPDEVPAISIRNPRGLAQEEVASLAEDMKLKAEESLGEVMLFTLIEMAKDSLTEGNIPHSPCIVCLEHFHEDSVFSRTACYHYFHNRCLHKYLQHVKAQLAEDEAEAARSGVHHRETSSKKQEIVCPMCRCPLDEETLAVECLESDEDDLETFVPSATLLEQQKEMAARFERQKAKGGIIDLEWEKNKYLLNDDDYNYTRAVPQSASATVEEERGETQPSENTQSGDRLKNETVVNSSRYRDAQRPSSHFHGRKFDDRRKDDRRKEFRGHGRVSRGFRDRHRNFHAAAGSDDDDNGTDSRRRRNRVDRSEYCVGDGKDGGPVDSYKGSDNSYGGNRFADDGGRLQGQEFAGGASKSYDRLHGKSYEYRGSGNRGRGWRDRGRGRGGNRAGDTFSSSDADRDEFQSREAGGQRYPPCPDSETSSFRGDGDDEDSSDHGEVGRLNHRHSHNQNDLRMDRPGHRNGPDDHRKRGRGQRGGRRFEDVSHNGGGLPMDARDVEHSVGRYEGGRAGRGRGSNPAKRQQGDRYSRQAEQLQGRQQRRGERGAERGYSNPDGRGNRSHTRRRKDAGFRGDDEDEDEGRVERADEERSEDGDVRNFEINQRWRSLNVMANKHHGTCASMPKKFGVIDADEDDSHDAQRGGEESSSDSGEAVGTQVRQNPNYDLANGELRQHYYPGCDRTDQEESWEDEIDQYATERTRFRGGELRKYLDHQKPLREHYANTLNDRVKEDRVMDEELRRMRKEDYERHGGHEEDREDDLDESLPPTQGTGMSILDQFKRDQEIVHSGSTGKESLLSGKTDNDTRYVSSGQRHKPLEEPPGKKFQSQGPHHSKDVPGSGSAVKDIEFRGNKPQRRDYPRASLDNEHEAGKSVNGDDAYELAWERRSALEKKSAKPRRSQAGRDTYDRPESKGGRQTDRSNRRRNERKGRYEKDVETSSQSGMGAENVKRPGDGERSAKREKTKKTTPRARETQQDLPERRYGHRMLEKPVDSNGSCEEPSVTVKTSRQKEFSKPKPLDLRKSNNPLTLSTTGTKDDRLNDAYGKSKMAQDIHCSQAGFKKPNPLDFRRQGDGPKDKTSPLSSSRHEPPKDLSS